MSNDIVINNFAFSVKAISDNELVNISSLARTYFDKTGKRKDPGHWLATKEAKESIAFLERATGIPVACLVIAENGVGTWVHADLAEIFAQWISVEYRFAVVRFIRGEKLKPKTALELAKEQVKLLEQLELQETQIKLLQEAHERQAEVIDELYDYSSIIRVAKYNGCSEKAFQWHKLKAASAALDAEIKKVPCPRFGSKNLYAHDAWRLAYPGYRLPETTTLVVDYNA
jgi:hypothetical protein